MAPRRDLAEEYEGIQWTTTIRQTHVLGRRPRRFCHRPMVEPRVKRQHVGIDRRFDHADHVFLKLSLGERVGYDS